MKRSILALGVLMAFSAPVSAGEYYIVHGQDRHCNVVVKASLKATTLFGSAL